jgi:hypothetical protein
MGMKKAESQRRQRTKAKEMSAHQKALKKKAEYEKQMKGKQFERVPHPTLKNTWILKEIN